MTFCMVSGGGRHSTPAMRVGGLTLAIAMLASAGCATGGDAWPDTVDRNTSSPVGTDASSTFASGHEGAGMTGGTSPAASASVVPGLTIIKPNEPAAADLMDGRSLGSADAPVKLDVWEDFQCPGCGVLAREMEPRLVNQYVRQGKLRITFHDFAFLGEESFTAATAARCAGEQGKFWSYKEYLFANQSGENKGTYNRTLFDGIARELGLNLDTFGACLSDGKARQEVVAETAQGDAVPVKQTPTVVVNGTIIDSLSYSAITSAIDAAISSN